MINNIISNIENKIELETYDKEQEHKHRIHEIDTEIAKFKNMMLKSNMLELPIVEEIVCSEKTIYSDGTEKTNEISVFYISNNNFNHIMYIPKTVKEIDRNLTSHIAKVKGKLTVIGGKGLEKLDSLFRGLVLDILDLTYLCTDNVTSIDNTFAHSRIGEIKGLEYFTTCNITTMCNAFYDCEVKNIDISAWTNNSKLKNTKEMFRKCTIQQLNMKGFDNRSVTIDSGMFKNSSIDFLNIKGIKSSIVIDKNSNIKEIMT